MIAYFVHNPESGEDHIVLPNASCSVRVTPERFEEFIGPKTAFSEWTVERCTDVSPEQFGTVVATRQEGEDVCIQNAELWQQRMGHYTGGGGPS
ncbi:MAG: hypothetical protein LJE65_06500 [Desulfobacteraceae bacterium]|jgi:hypothetical protein|nr:hypothetical protein [Desulfobacteraceae bacterium]